MAFKRACNDVVMNTFGVIQEEMSRISLCIYYQTYMFCGVPEESGRKLSRCT